MNCLRFESVVGELARNQMMEADVRGEALAHRDACEECASRLRAEEVLTGRLQSLAAEMKSLEAPPQVELQIREAFRRQEAAPLVAASSIGSRYWLAAVAAVLLIVVSLVAVRWRSDNVVAPQIATPKAGHADNVAVQRNESDLSAKEVGFSAGDPKPKRTSGKNRRTGFRQPRNAVVANHVTNEIATEFMPLGYMNAANLQDGGQIVRVELPRSALARLGLPVNMDRYNEKVKADVLLGVDGLAHAIRFVQ